MGKDIDQIKLVTLIDFIVDYLLLKHEDYTVNLNTLSTECKLELGGVNQSDIDKALDILKDEELLTIKNTPMPDFPINLDVELTTTGRFHFISWSDWMQKKKDETEIPKKALKEQTKANNLTATQIWVSVLLAIILFIAGVVVGRYS